MLNTVETSLADLLGVRLSRQRRPEWEPQYRPVPLRNTAYLLYVERDQDHAAVFRLKSTLEALLGELEALRTTQAEHTLLRTELQAMQQASQGSGFEEAGAESEFNFLERFDIQYALWQEGRLLVNTGLTAFTLHTGRQRLEQTETFRVPIRQGEMIGFRSEVFSLLVLSPVLLSEALHDLLYTKLWWLTRSYRQTTSELEVVFHTFPDLYLRLDADGTILDYKAHPDIPFSITWLGKPLQEIIPNAQAGRQFARAIRQARETGQVVSVEYFFSTGEHSSFHEARFAPLGKHQIVAVIRDITARKQQEETLHRSETRFRQLFEASPDGITLLDAQGRIEDCGPAALHLYSRPQGDIVGHPITEFLAPAFREQALAGMEQLRQLHSVEREIQILRGDGRVVDVWRKAVPRTDAQGRFNGSLLYDRDITALKQAEAELRKLYQAVEQSANAIVITDLDGTIEFVNPAFTRTTGYTFQESIGHNPNLLKSGYHPPEFYRDLWDTLKRGEVWRREFCNRRKSGELYWEDTIITPVKDAAGRTTHYLAIKVDITERKRNQEALKLQHKQQAVINRLLRIGLEDLSLEHMLDRMLEELLRLDWLALLPQGGIFLAEEPEVLTLKAQRNLAPELQTLCRQVAFGQCLCGRAAASRQVQFADCVDARHENHYPGIQPHGHYNVPILSGQEVLGVMVFYLPEGHQTQPGEQRFLQIVARTLAGIIRRRQAEEALVSARDQALAASRLKTQILHSVNHDLRSPLGAILGYMELLQEGIYGPLSDEQRQAVDKVADSGHYLARLVDDLLDAAQLEAGQLALHPKPFQVAEMVEHTVNPLHVLAERKGLKLQVEFAVTLPSRLVGDADRLQRILTNLIGNAIKFTQSGEVRVRILRPDPEHWGIQVSDTGIGILEDEQEQIFQPFQRAHDIRQRYTGVGLGLAIAYQLVHMMDGTLHLQSAPGRGSTFTVLLPLILSKEDEP